jgi:lysozyme
MLELDMRKSLDAVVRLCPNKLSVNQLAALTDFAFNCGAGNLQSSTLRKCVLRGDFEQAAFEFLKWDKAQGIKLKGLTKRRLAESKLFKS